jgi:hypothetical protein
MRFVGANQKVIFSITPRRIERLGVISYITSLNSASGATNQ